LQGSLVAVFPDVVTVVHSDTNYEVIFLSSNLCIEFVSNSWVPVHENEEVGRINFSKHNLRCGAILLLFQFFFSM